VRSQSPNHTLLVIVSILLSSLAHAQERPSRTDQFGDPLPERALFRIGTNRLQHNWAVDAVAISNDGRLLASCGRDQVLQIWDAKDGKPLQKFDLPVWGPWALSFSHDGSEIAAVSKSRPHVEGAFRRWNLRTGRELSGDRSKADALNGLIYHVALTSRADGTFVAAESDEPAVGLYTPGDPKSRKSLNGHTGRIMSLCFTKDAKTLISLDTKGMIRFWDTADGKEISKFPAPKMDPARAALDGNLACIAASPDGKTLAVSLPDETTRLINTKGEELRRLPSTSQFNAMAFSADGHTLVTGGRLVEKWRVADAKPIPTLSEPREPMVGLALSPDGRIAVGMNSQERLRWVDVEKGKVVFDRDVPCKSGIAFSPDGKHFVTAGARNQIAFWDVATIGKSPNAFGSPPASVLRCEGKVSAFAFAPDGKRLAAVEDEKICRLYGVESKKCLVTIKPPGRSVYAIAFSPDGKLLATMGVGSGEQEGTAQVVRLWHTVSGKESPIEGELRLFGHTIVFHPNGRSLAGLLLPTLARHPLSPGFVDIGPDSSPPRLPVEDRMESIRIWDLGVKHERLRFDDPVQRRLAESDNGWVIGHSQATPAVFSPDGAMLATITSAGVVVYETASGQPRMRLPGHLAGITGLSFAPDGNTLITTSWDSTILIWDVNGSRTMAKARGTPEELWKTLADADVEKAGRAVFAMSESRADALVVLKARVKPVSVTPESMDKLVADLDHSRFAMREQAARDLAMLGRIAESVLRKKLASKPSPEATTRIEKLLAELKAIRPNPDQLRELRVVEVLERMGTSQARAFLRELASGTEAASLTKQAAEAVGRIGGWTSK